MATNPYFSYNVASEQNLYEDLIIESIQVKGVNVYYLPREMVLEDKILGDEVPSRFDNAYLIEMYLNNVDGFGGQGDLFQRFGIEIRDQATFTVSSKRWNTVVADSDNTITGIVPREGDLLYFPLSKSMFEIMHVERENPFYQIGNTYTFDLTCELFEYGDEDFDTGVTEIDDIEDYGYKYEITFDSDSDAAGVFVAGSNIVQTLSDGNEIRAEILSYNRTTQKLVAVHVGSQTGDELHLFTVGSTVTDSDTSATKIIRSVKENLGDYGYANDVYDSAVDWIDFSESNPFGGISN